MKGKRKPSVSKKASNRWSRLETKVCVCEFVLSSANQDGLSCQVPHAHWRCQQRFEFVTVHLSCLQQSRMAAVASCPTRTGAVVSKGLCLCTCLVLSRPGGCSCQLPHAHWRSCQQRSVFVHSSCTQQTRMVADASCPTCTGTVFSNGLCLRTCLVCPMRGMLGAHVAGLALEIDIIGAMCMQKAYSMGL